MLVLLTFLLIFHPIYSKICNSPECKQISKRYLMNMNSSVNPCDDFYEFTCGNYAETHEIAQHSGSVRMLHEISDGLDKHLLDVLFDRTVTSKPVIFAQRYFRSCMRFRKSLTPFQKLVSQVFPDDHVSWEIIAGKLSLHNIQPVFSIEVEQSLQNSSESILHFKTPELHFESEESYKDVKIMGYYKTYLMDLFDQFDCFLSEREIDDIINFEKSLATISFDDQTNHSYHDNLMSYSKFKRTYIGVIIYDYFNKDLQEYMNLNDNSKINIFNLEFFKNLEAILKTTSNSAIVNYLKFNFFKHYLDYLPESYKRPKEVFKQQIFGLKPHKTREAMCLNEVSKKLDLQLAAGFIEKYFKKDDKKMVESMVQNIKSVMRDILKNAIWLDDLTRNEALKKLEKMKELVGYPEYILNETRLFLPFENVNMNGKYLEIVVGINKAKRRYNLLGINRPIEIDWSNKLININAHYNANLNAIFMNAGILQFPMFSPNAPIYTNYGSVGFVIAHEITHGFDDEGSQYDGDGHLRNWWDYETSKKYVDASQCFVDQYGKQKEKLTGRILDGKLTLGENIGDNGGIRLAYEGYLRTLNKLDVVEDLEGFSKYTKEQMFFISYGNMLCESWRPEAMNQLLKSDPHTPGDFRVNIPLQNFPEFSKAFQCKLESKMNPEKKCRVW